MSRRPCFGGAVVVCGVYAGRVNYSEGKPEMATDVFGASSAYTHNGDHDLLASLGLKTDDFGREWTPLGTVVVQEAEPNGEFGPRPAATVDVEVSALPAQWWRFTISRPRDDSETVDGEVRGIYEPLERFVMTTASGGFTTYWPIAKLIAEHMLYIERS